MILYRLTRALDHTLRRAGLMRCSQEMVQKFYYRSSDGVLVVTFNNGFRLSGYVSQAAGATVISDIDYPPIRRASNLPRVEAPTHFPVSYDDFSIPRCSFCHTQLGLPHHPLCQRPGGRGEHTRKLIQGTLYGQGRPIDSEEIGEEMGG